MKTARAPEYAPCPDRKWSWPKYGIASVVVLAVAILAVVALRDFGAQPPVEPVALARSVYERDAQLRAADANEMDVLQLERDTQEDELTRLRAQDAAQAKRIQQLELTVADLNPSPRERQTPAPRPSSPAPSSVSPTVPAIPPLAEKAAAPANDAPAGIAPSAGARRVTVKASGMNWVSACSDGKPAFAKLLMAGDARDIEFQSTAVVRVGNAAAAEIYVEGKSLGSLGSPGSVRTVEVSTVGHRNLPNSAPEAECQASHALVATQP